MNNVSMQLPNTWLWGTRGEFNYQPQVRARAVAFWWWWWRQAQPYVSSAGSRFGCSGCGHDPGEEAGRGTLKQPAAS